MTKLHLVTLVAALCVPPNSLLADTAVAPPNLKELQKNIYAHEASCRAASVGVRPGHGGQGSGVIISKDGIILTAAHVVEQVGTELVVTLANGQSAKAIALLVNQNTDSAIARITTPAPKNGFPHRPLSTLGKLEKGHWCTVIAHAGGVQADRPAPLRIGRVLTTNTKTTGKKGETYDILVTDCTVTSGDSGGPLFDSQGNICGINASIGATSALENNHVSIETFRQQWGNYLDDPRTLPTPEQATKTLVQAKNQLAIPGVTLSPELIPAMKNALSETYPHLPETGIIELLKCARFENGKLTIDATPQLAENLAKLGIDPNTCGIPYKTSKDKNTPADKKADPKKTTPKEKKLSTEETIKQQFGNLPAKAHQYIKEKFPTNKIGSISLTPEDMKNLRKLGADTTQITLRQTILSRFDNPSEEAIQYLLTKFKKNEQGIYNIVLNEADMFKLKKLGLNSLKASSNSDKDMLTAMFKKKYGEDLPQQALDLLLKSTIIDKATGNYSMRMDADSYQRLLDLGVDLKPKNQTDLEPFSKSHGDSADSIIKTLPPLPAPVHLIQNNKRIGLATTISADGQLLCKSSSLKNGQNISLQINGNTTPAKVIARDKTSDLALIQAQLKKGQTLATPAWSNNDQRGTIIISSTEAKPKIGVISVPKRTIPGTSTANGNKAILGVASDKTKNIKGAFVLKVFPESPAEKAGIKTSDVITSINGIPIHKPAQLTKELGKYKPQDTVTFSITRGTQNLKLTATLVPAEKNEIFPSDEADSPPKEISAHAGELSNRRTNFPEAFSHDALIWDDDCGGPVYNLDGQLLGINIARFSRVTNYTLTQKSINEALARMNR